LFLFGTRFIALWDGNGRGRLFLLAFSSCLIGLVCSRHFAGSTSYTGCQPMLLLCLCVLVTRQAWAVSIVCDEVMSGDRDGGLGFGMSRQHI
jgi:hypothetical protein